MPLYFFDVVDGQDIPDTEGSDLADLAAARLEAIRLSGEILREMPERFWACETWTMTVSDQNRAPLFKLDFLARNIAGDVPI